MHNNPPIHDYSAPVDDFFILPRILATVHIKVTTKVLKISLFAKKPKNSSKSDIGF